MFSACANAFLGVGCAFQMGIVRVGVYGSEEDGFVLDHASIGEEEAGIVVRDDGGGGDYKLTYEFVQVRLLRRHAPKL